MSKKLSLLVNFIGVDKLSGSLRSIQSLGRKGTRSLGELRGEGRKLEAQLRQVRREFDGASGNVTELIERERALEHAIESTNRELGERKRLNAIEANRKARRARGDAMMNKGREQMVQGATIAAPLILAGKAAMDYDTQLRTLAQTMDLDQATQEKLGKSLLRTSQIAYRMPDDVISGAAFLGSKGATAKQIEGTMPHIAKFATAWNSDVVDASKAAYASQLSLKVGIGQTGRALEIMAAAGKAGGFEVRDMAQHFPTLAAGLAALGSKGIPAVGDLSAALQVLEGKTGDGQAAATVLDNLMAFPMTDMGIRRFKKFGIDVTAALKQAEKDGRSPLETLIELTEKATGGDEMRVGELFSNKQAAEAMRGLMTEKDQYLRIRRQALAAQGLTDQEFRRMSEGSAANWAKLKGNVSTLAIVFGDKLLPSFIEGATYVTALTTKIGNWAEANPEAAGTIMKIVASLALFKIGLGATQFLFGGFLKTGADFIGFFRKVDGVSRFGTMMSRLGGILGTTAKIGMRAFGLLRMGAMFLARGIMQAGLMMLANPMVLAITLIVVAIAGAAYLIYKHWDTIKAAFFNAWGAIKSFFGKAPDWLKGIGRAMMTGLLMAINPMALAAKLISVAKNGITAFKNYLGIKSPSRVFMAMGEHTGEGLAIGLDRKRGRVAGAAGRMAAGMTAAGAMAMAPTALAAQAGSGGKDSGGAPITIHIHQQPGEDASDLARRVADIIDRRQRGAARGTYQDEY